MKTRLFLFCLSMIALDAWAFGTFRDAKITQIRIDQSGKAMIFFDRDKTGDPATCGHNAYNRALGIDASTEGGKAVLSIALAAKATGSPVLAHGTGGCGVYGGNIIETWNHGFIK